MPARRLILPATIPATPPLRSGKASILLTLTLLPHFSLREGDPTGLTGNRKKQRTKLSLNELAEMKSSKKGPKPDVERRVAPPGTPYREDTDNVLRCLESESESGMLGQF